jgi:hypothetical protein
VTREAAISWLDELEKYFQMQSIMCSEDYAIQAFAQNALNARKVSEIIKNGEEK